ncbi:hypothetical protein SEMRO_3225_G345580.1 [Seminavis robusta]|uniref:Uncharacterized protein n=1 Tax=Seminavis robusta TaxID=568900 RepID=A0A9N8HXN9_9STRA|nr:hypothetical protein SEMRO_3225_G345580.1 [Seminavis robusta]|eukprot:Sro3225_g345580.1 n/a (276) ;mRNA; r:2509-3336
MKRASCCSPSTEASTAQDLETSLRSKRSRCSRFFHSSFAEEEDDHFSKYGFSVFVENQDDPVVVPVSVDEAARESDKAEEKHGKDSRSGAVKSASSSVATLDDGSVYVDHKGMDQGARSSLSRRQKDKDIPRFIFVPVLSRTNDTADTTRAIPQKHTPNPKKGSTRSQHQTKAAPNVPCTPDAAPIQETIIVGPSLAVLKAWKKQEKAKRPYWFQRLFLPSPKPTHCSQLKVFPLRGRKKTEPRVGNRPKQRSIVPLVDESSTTFNAARKTIIEC